MTALLSIAACHEQIKASLGKFYVYLLVRPDGTPFYVGCGEARVGRHQHRILDHEQMARRGIKSLKCNLIRKIWAAGGEVGYLIDSWHDSATDVFAREVALIAALGRRDLGRGPLANGNDGGTGNLNMRRPTGKRKTGGWTPEKRAAAAERLREQRKNDPSMREKSAAGVRAAWNDPVQGPRLLQKAKANGDNPESKAKRIAGLKRLVATPEYRLVLSDRMKRNWANDEVRARILDTRAKTTATSEYKKRRSEIATAIMSRPGMKENTAEKQRAVWADPDYRRHHSERLATLSRNRSPEVEARRVAAIRKYHAETKLRKIADGRSRPL